MIISFLRVHEERWISIFMMMSKQYSFVPLPLQRLVTWFCLMSQKVLLTIFIVLQWGWSNALYLHSFFNHNFIIFFPSFWVCVCFYPLYILMCFVCSSHLFKHNWLNWGSICYMQDVFPVIPGDTDYRIFSQDYGNIPGLDIIFLLGGYFYHTSYDTMERLLYALHLLFWYRFT